MKEKVILGSFVVRILFSLWWPLCESNTTSVVDTERERRNIVDALNKVYLESLGKKVLGRALGTLGQPTDGLGSIKLVEKIVSSLTGSPGNASMIMMLFWTLRSSSCLLASRIYKWTGRKSQEGNFKIGPGRR